MTPRKGICAYCGCAVAANERAAYAVTGYEALGS